MHLGPLFVGMALLYPWATKDYLLWNMSIGQIIMYYNMGMEAKYPDPDSDKNKLKNMSYDEVKAIRDEMRNLGLSTVEEYKEAKIQQAEDKKQELARKYGDINDG